MVHGRDTCGCSFKIQSPGNCTAIEKCPIAIQFLGTYVIVMGVSNTQMNLAYVPLDMDTPNDPAKVMTFAAMVNIGGNAS